MDHKELDRLREVNAQLRRALKASVTANAMYEVLEEAYRDLLQAGKGWVADLVDVYGPCGGCGECSTCTLVALIEDAKCDTPAPGGDSSYGT